MGDLVMAFTYKIVTIEDFQDDAATEAVLNVEGAANWELVQAEFSPQADSTITATCIFKQ
jgi:hypothetical protein